MSDSKISELPVNTGLAGEDLVAVVNDPSGSPQTQQATMTQVQTFLAASQSDMETATSTILMVTPGRQHFHPGHPKFWCKTDNAGAASASYNVTSIGDTAVGQMTVTIATDFSGADWCCLGMCETAGAQLRTPQVDTGGQAAGTVLVEVRNTGNSLADPASYYIAGLGDHA